MSSKQHQTIAGEQKLAWSRIIAYGLQQAFLIASYAVMLKIVLDYGHQSQQHIISAFQGAMLILGIAAALQAVRHRWLGSGLLAPSIISAIYLQVSVLAIQTGGFGLVLGMTVFAGLVEIIVSFFLTRLRIFFRTPVVGLIVTVVGFQLGVIGFENAVGHNIADVSNLSHDLLYAAVVFAVILICMIWGKGFFRIIAILIGLLVGFCLVIFTGKEDPAGLALWHQANWFGYPHLFQFRYQFDAHYIIPFFICGFVAAMRAMGAIVTAQMMNDAKWTQPDYPLVRKAVRTDGLNCVLAGFLGCIGVSLGPSLIGLSRATNIVSRKVGFVIAIFLIVLAFFPKIVLSVELIPNTILGVSLMFTASFMFMAGIQVMCRSPLSVRDVLIIGLSYFLGASFLIDPAIYKALPSFMLPFTDSLLTISTVVAVILTLLFRLGIKTKLKLQTGNKILSVKQFTAGLQELDNQVQPSTHQCQKAKAVLDNMLHKLAANGDVEKNIVVEAEYNEQDLWLDIHIVGGQVDIRDLEIYLQHETMLEEQSFAAGLINTSVGAIPDDYKLKKVNHDWHLRLCFYP